MQIDTLYIYVYIVFFLHFLEIVKLKNMESLYFMNWQINVFQCFYFILFARQGKRV